MRRRNRKAADDALLATFERLVLGTRVRPLFNFLEEHPVFVPVLLRLVDQLIGPDRDRYVEAIRRQRHLAVHAPTGRARADAHWGLRLIGYDDASLRAEEPEPIERVTVN